ncbi:exosome non-catalytic core subunit rrp4 [Clydaea vesicula]|uniref:Exosome non-catalytic core subunit rrp4 n=1 Tax=Clydaea vesicula TaxID=447962 RepID=A0AAD5TV76_9FUNG|nr:exosome non-catalytic core subunit rrp4 [Clydaea vesicula]
MSVQFYSANSIDKSRKIGKVTPGEIITDDQQYMRGHGTYSNEENLVASLGGVIERVNKLISVKPLRARYNGEIGDVIVGRITEVQQKRWKVDLNARQDATLLLSSVNLPGGVQRRKTELDELHMRSFFVEGHLLSAEVQSFFQDGGASLHTRSNKYGKLRNGSLVTVPSALIKRSKSHFITLPCGVDLILGVNGYIWVSKHVENIVNNDPDSLYSNENEVITDETRETIARVSNCIKLLATHDVVITNTMIVYTYDASLQYHPKELLKFDVGEQIIEIAKAQSKELGN